jgi:hypothetical protein
MATPEAVLPDKLGQSRVDDRQLEKFWVDEISL